MGGRSTFGSVRKLPSGRFQASYHAETEERKGRYKAPQTFASRAEANAWLSGIETDMRRGGWIDPVAGTETFGKFATQWLEQRHDIRPSTHDDYLALLKKHLLPAFGGLRLSAVTPSRVRTWNSTLARTHPARAAKAYRLLRTIMGTAVSDRLLLQNPCQVRGASTEHAPERAIPTIAEVDALSEAMPERLRLLPQLAAWCGLRRGELLGLERGDFDMLHDTVRISRAVTERAGGILVIGDPKTEAGRRVVSIPPHLVPAVESHLEDFAGPESDAVVFTNADGTRLRKRPLRYHWVKAQKAVGVTYNVHDLRHLGATLAATAGASTRELMRRIGHASPQAALRYQHATDDRDTAIAAALSDLGASKVTPIQKAR